jgi:hypothetical protein
MTMPWELRKRQVNPKIQNFLLSKTIFFDYNIEIQIQLVIRGVKKLFDSLSKLNFDLRTGAKQTIIF